MTRLVGKWNSHSRHRYQRAGRVDATLVAEFRRYARQEGYVLSQREQAKHLQQTFYGYGMSREALGDVLANRSWYDATYVPGEPDHAYWQALGPTSALLMVMAGG